MHFLSGSETASQDILSKVGQEAVLESGEKGAKSECLECWDRFIGLMLYHAVGFMCTTEAALMLGLQSPHRNGRQEFLLEQ